MKRIALTLGIAALLGLASCTGDDPSPQSPQAVADVKDGVYAPGVKIDSVVVVDEGAEHWVWGEDGRLEYVEGDGPVKHFEYDGERVRRVVMDEDTLEYVYSGNYLTEVRASGGLMVGNRARVSHDGQGRISRLQMDLSDEEVIGLLDMFMQGRDEQPEGKPAPSTKDAGYTTFNMDLAWSGGNVGRIVLTAHVARNMSTAELRDNFGFMFSRFNIPEAILNMVGEGGLPVEVDVKDTIDYVYDRQHNPLQGYMGEFEPALFSANNVLTATMHGTVVATATLPMMGAQKYPIAIPGSTTEFGYEYNEEGYPTLKTEDDKQTKYIYKN